MTSRNFLPTIQTTPKLLFWESLHHDMIPLCHNLPGNTLHHKTHSDTIKKAVPRWSYRIKPSSLSAHQRYQTVRHLGIHHNDPIAFTIQPHKKRHILETTQNCGDDEFGCICTTLDQLLSYLFSDYPTILKRIQNISDPSACPSFVPKRRFIMIPAPSTSQMDEPFLIIELLNYETPNPSSNENVFYYKILDHFLEELHHMSNLA